MDMEKYTEGSEEGTVVVHRKSLRYLPSPVQKERKKCQIRLVSIVFSIAFQIEPLRSAFPFTMAPQAKKRLKAEK
jgi:hypothetical protein